MQIRTTSNIPEVSAILASAAKHFGESIYPKLRQLAAAKLNEQVRKGNNQYSVSVDGRASNTAGIQSATKAVRIQFAAAAVKLAIRILRDELSRAIGETTTTRSGKLKNDIIVVYGAPGKPFRHVENVKEISFEPGGLVAVMPSAYYAGIVNHFVAQATGRAKRARHAATNAKRAAKGKAPLKASAGRGVGFIGLAAKRVRSAIGNVRGQRNQSVNVKAIFSTAIPAQAGVHPPAKLMGRGWPCIILEMRASNTANIVRS